MGSIEYLRIIADEEGCSHFENKAIDLEARDYAPPAPHLNTSILKSADNSAFLELPIGWYGDWHPTPVRQWLILMTGMCEFEAGDGEKVTRRAGEVVMCEENTASSTPRLAGRRPPGRVSRSPISIQTGATQCVAR